MGLLPGLLQFVQGRAIEMKDEGEGRNERGMLFALLLIPTQNISSPLLDSSSRWGKREERMDGGGAGGKAG